MCIEELHTKEGLLESEFGRNYMKRIPSFSTSHELLMNIIIYKYFCTLNTHLAFL